jgi:hypothetical protein
MAGKCFPWGHIQVGSICTESDKATLSSSGTNFWRLDVVGADCGKAVMDVDLSLNVFFHFHP